MAVALILVGSVVLLSLYYLRQYFAGGVFKSSKRLDGKTVIITGANTGIGKETAIDLAQRGARVIIACRDVLRGTLALKEIQEQSNSQKVYFEQLDLASFKSIRDFAERIKKSETKLHILINNAGLSMVENYALTQDGFEMTFGVNHLGPFLLTNLLLDLLKKSAPSRIVNVSSIAHRFVKTVKFSKEEINDKGTYTRLAYNESKLANILFTRELAKRLEGTGVTSYALHPGVVKTEFFRRETVRIKLFVTIFGRVLKLFKTPKEGAQTTLYCALSEDLEGVSGRYYADCAEKQPSESAKDDGAARKLWEVSEEFVGL